MKAAGISARVSALTLTLTLAACASGGPTLPTPSVSAMPAPQYLADRPLSAKTKPSAEAPNTAAADSAASGPASAGEASDPLEASNRSVFEGNQAINHAIIYPVAKAYQDVVPEPVRDSIDAFTTNLSEPLVFANDILQLRFNAAGKTFTRFAVNSTVGLGGLFDVAATQGLTKQSGDFGQTMYVWGVRDSSYVVLPIIGPSNVRDTIGNVVELVVPSQAVALAGPRFAATLNNISNAGSVASPFSGINKVAQLKELEDNSLDFYTMMRSVVEQKREAELQDALSSSAFTTPLDKLPGADVQPIMTLGAPPAFAEAMTDRPLKARPFEPKTAEAAAPATAQQQSGPVSTSRVIIGVPTAE